MTEYKKMINDLCDVVEHHMSDSEITMDSVSDYLDVLVEDKSLQDYFNGLRFCKEDLMQILYYKFDGHVYTNPEMLEMCLGLESERVHRREVHKARLYKTLSLLKSLYHETEHMTQTKRLNEPEDSFESAVLQATYMPFMQLGLREGNIDKRTRFELMEHYRKLYYSCPFERMADTHTYYVLRDVLKELHNRGIDSPSFEKRMYDNQVKTYQAGYKKGKNVPLRDFCKNVINPILYSGVIDNLMNIPSYERLEEMSGGLYIEQVLKYGLPISHEEYKNIKTLTLK